MTLQSTLRRRLRNSIFDFGNWHPLQSATATLLPIEVAESIFKHLDATSLCNSALVCRAWTLPVSYILWREHDPPVEHLFQVLPERRQAYADQIRRLVFTNRDGFRFSDQLYQLEFPKVEEVWLWERRPEERMEYEGKPIPGREDSEQSPGLPAFLQKKCPDIRALNIYHFSCNYSEEFLPFLQSFKLLERIRFGERFWWERLTGDTLNYLAGQRLRHLHLPVELDASHMHQFLHSAVQEPFRHLESLTLTGSVYNIVPIIANLTCIVDLQLSLQCYSQTAEMIKSSYNPDENEFLDIVQNMSSLKSLVIGCGPWFSRGFTFAKSSFLGLSKLTNLRHLFILDEELLWGGGIVKCEPWTDHEVASFFSSLPLLQRLALGIGRPTYFNVADIIRHLPDLRVCCVPSGVLDLDGEHRDNAGPLHSKLEVLKCWSVVVPDDSPRRLLEKLPRLSRLEPGDRRTHEIPTRTLDLLNNLVHMPYEDKVAARTANGSCSIQDAASEFRRMTRKYHHRFAELDLRFAADCLCVPHDILTLRQTTRAGVQHPIRDQIRDTLLECFTHHYNWRFIWCLYCPFWTDYDCYDLPVPGAWERESERSRVVRYNVPWRDPESRELTREAQSREELTRVWARPRSV